VELPLFIPIRCSFYGCRWWWCCMFLVSRHWWINKAKCKTKPQKKGHWTTKMHKQKEQTICSPLERKALVCMPHMPNETCHWMTEIQIQIQCYGDTNTPMQIHLEKGERMGETIGECRTASEEWFRLPAKRNFWRCREWYGAVPWGVDMLDSIVTTPI